MLLLVELILAIEALETVTPPFLYIDDAPDEESS
jgi:hypothetical protein